MEEDLDSFLFIRKKAKKILKILKILNYFFALVFLIFFVGFLFSLVLGVGMNVHYSYSYYLLIPFYSPSSSTSSLLDVTML